MADGFVRRADHVVWKVVHGKALLLNLNSGAYFDISPVGLMLWKLCDGEKKNEKIILLASRRFKITPERIKKDAYCFINDLKRNKLVEVISKPTRAAKPHSLKR